MSKCKNLLSIPILLIIAQVALASPKDILTVPVINNTSCVCNDTECHRERGVTVMSWRTDPYSGKTFYATITPGAPGAVPVNSLGNSNVITLSNTHSPYVTNDPYSGLYIYTATTPDYWNYCTVDEPCYPTASNDPCLSGKLKR